MLPRWLYLSMFVWLAAPGRFTSLFFAEQGLSDTQVGLCMALTPLVGALCGPGLALLADRAEAARMPLVLLPAFSKSTGVRFVALRGHEGVLALSVIAATASFVLFLAAPQPRLATESVDDGQEGSGDPSNERRFAFFLFVRVLYSASMAPLFGVLDGLALRRLAELGFPASSYGQERLYGAYGWALSSLLFGVASDYAVAGASFSGGGISATAFPFMAAAAILVLATLAAFSDAKEPSGAVAGGAEGRKSSAGAGGSIACTTTAAAAAAATSPVAVPTVDFEEEEKEHDEEGIGTEGGHCHRAHNLHGHDRSEEGGMVQLMSTKERPSSVELSTAFIKSRPSSLSSSSSSPSPSAWRPWRWRCTGSLLLLCRAFFASPQKGGFVLCAVALTAGTSIVENLLFLFFDEALGATGTICGLSVVVTVVFEVPIFARAGALLERCGAGRLLAVACLAYATRVVGYTVVPSPWLVLCLEPLHGVTYSCLKTSLTHFVALATPRPGQATRGGGGDRGDADDKDAEQEGEGDAGISRALDDHEQEQPQPQAPQQQERDQEQQYQGQDQDQDQEGHDEQEPLDATAQGLMGAITGLFGSLLGTGLGGYVQDEHGPRVLYRGAGAVVLVALCIYGVLEATSRYVVRGEGRRGKRGGGGSGGSGGGEEGGRTKAPVNNNNNNKSPVVANPLRSAARNVTPTTKKPEEAGFKFQALSLTDDEKGGRFPCGGAANNGGGGRRRV